MWQIFGHSFQILSGCSYHDFSTRVNGFHIFSYMCNLFRWVSEFLYPLHKFGFPSKTITNDKTFGQLETFHVVRISIWPGTMSQQCRF